MHNNNKTADMPDARSTYRSLACRQLLIAPHPLAPQPLRTAMHTCMGETDVSDALPDQIVLHPPVLGPPRTPLTHESWESQAQ